MDPDAPEATGQRKEPTPLSRQQERNRIDELGLCVGACVRVVWRTRETLDEERGEWTTTTVTITAADADELGRQRWTTEFELENLTFEGFLPMQSAFEVAELTRVRAPPRKLTDVLRAKRPRDQQPAAQGMTVEMATATAQAMIDAKRGRPTVQLPGGEGLRVPSSTASIYAAVFPHIWWAKVAEETAPKAPIMEEWRAAAEELRHHLGATFRNPNRREAYAVALENLAALVLRAPPATRLEWRTAFANVKAYLREIFVVSHSAKHGDLIEKKIGEMFDEGLLDLELAIRKTEAETAEKDHTKDKDNSARDKDSKDLAEENRLLRSQVSALAARTADNDEQGGGRGGWRGGRGWGRGRGRGFRP